MDIQSVRKIALALPEVTEAPHFGYASFRVKGKIFVTVPPDGCHVHVFVGEQDRLVPLAIYPEALEPLHWGESVLGLRVDLARARPETVEQLIRDAWRNKAPRRLLTAAGRDDAAD